MEEGVEHRAIHRLQSGEWTLQKDQVAIEAPLIIDIVADLQSSRWLSMLRTPGHDVALVTGLMNSEDILIGCRPVDAVVTLSEGKAEILLPRGCSFNISARGRMNSGAACGICGRKDFSDLIERLHVCSVERLEVDVELLLTLPDKMMQVQSGFTSTGGIHAAALFSNQGELLVNMEDIGRHNAVDKVIGHCIGENIDSSAGIICLSGRIGSELVLKAAAAMIPVIVAIGAASSMAIDLARQAGISLYGFTRNGNTVSYNNTQGLILKSDNRKQIGE